MGPALMIRHLALGNIMPSAVARYVADSTRANLLKQVGGSLPGMAYAFRCYLSLWELENAAPPPPGDEMTLRWSSVSNDTTTHGSICTSGRTHALSCDDRLA